MTGEINGNCTQCIECGTLKYPLGCGMGDLKCKIDGRIKAGVKFNKRIAWEHIWSWELL